MRRYTLRANENTGQNVVDTVATTVLLSFKCGIIYNTAIRDKILAAITAVLADRSESEKCVQHVSLVVWSYF